MVFHKRLAFEVGIEVLRDAEVLLTEVIPADQLWERALELAVITRHPAYDAFFVALAERTGSRLVTFEQRLRRIFPQHVILANEFLP